MTTGNSREATGNSTTINLFCFALWASLFALCDMSSAQQQAKLPKIGWLAVRPASAAFAIESFQREFSKLGYVDGKNIVFEYRYAEGKLDRLPALADELVRLKVDLIIAPNTPAAVAATNATKISRSFLLTGRSWWTDVLFGATMSKRSGVPPFTWINFSREPKLLIFRSNNQQSLSW